MEKILISKDLTSIEYTDRINYPDNSFIRISLYADNSQRKNVDVSDLERTLFAAFSQNTTACDLRRIVFIVRTIFRDFNEQLLIIRTGKDNKIYNSISYKDGALMIHKSNSKLESENFRFLYEKGRGCTFSTSNKEEDVTDYRFGELVDNTFREELKRTASLNNADGKKALTDDDKGIYKAYSLFYNEEPDFRDQISVIKAHVMAFILNEYGVGISAGYGFRLADGYPYSVHLNKCIDNSRLLGKIESKDYDVKFKDSDRKRKELIGRLVCEFVNQLPKGYPYGIAMLGNIMYTKLHIRPSANNKELAQHTGFSEGIVESYSELVKKLKSIDNENN